MVRAVDAFRRRVGSYGFQVWARAAADAHAVLAKQQRGLERLWSRERRRVFASWLSFHLASLSLLEQIAHRSVSRGRKRAAWNDWCRVVQIVRRRGIFVEGLRKIARNSLHRAKSCVWRTWIGFNANCAHTKWRLARSLASMRRNAARARPRARARRAVR